MALISQHLPRAHSTDLKRRSKYSLCYTGLTSYINFSVSCKISIAENKLTIAARAKQILQKMAKKPKITKILINLPHFGIM
jgi:hypothetical protein